MEERRDNDFYINKEGINNQESRPKKVKIIFTVIALILLTGTAALAMRLWDPYWNPFRPSPETIFNNAVMEMMKIETMHSEIRLKADFDNIDGSRGIDIKISSDSDNTDPLTPKFQSDFEIALIDKGMRMFFTGEVRGIGDVFYLKIDTIPLPITASLMMMGIDLDQWRGEWISVDPRDMGMSFTSDPEEMEALEKKLIELLKEYPLLVSEQEFSNKTIDDRETYHYLFTLRRENAIDFLTEIVDYQIKRTGIEEREVSEEEREEIREFVNRIDDVPFEVYIDKKNLLIRKIVIKDTFDISDKSLELDGKLNIDLEIKFSGFEESMTIIAPDDSLSILEVFENLIKATNLLFGGGTQERAMDARIISALGQTRAVAEIIYSRDDWQYNNICLSPTSLEISDTTNGLDILQAEIIDNGGVIACYATGNNYCISSNLNENGQFWCVNSAGKSGKAITACTSATTGCTGLGF